MPALSSSTGLVDQLSKLIIQTGSTGIGSNLATLSKGVRVEPFHIVNNELTHYSDMEAVTGTMLSLFSAYYLQATAALVTLSDAFVRDIITATATSAPIGLAIESQAFTNPEKFRFSLEKSVVGPNTVRDVPTPTNLALGKIIEINIDTPDGNRVTIPVSVRFLNTIVSPRVVNSILTKNSEDITFTERFEQWRAGRISFWKDLVLAQDLIKARQKALLEDENSVLMNLEDRKRRGVLMTVIKSVQKLINGNGGVGGFSAGSRSNLLTITKNDQIATEGRTGQRFSDQKYMKRLQDELGLICLTVVDTDKDRVTFYLYGSDAPTTVTTRELKNREKKGQDIMEMVKLLSSGVSPLA